jgi:hypothetical protein
MKVLEGKGIDARSREFKLANEFYRQNKDLLEVTDDKLKEFYDRMTYVNLDKFKDFAKRTMILNQQNINQ